VTLRESAKVLYTVTPTPDQIKQWQDNITTDKMDLPYDLLVALALALVQSSRCLPPQARHAQNDLKIGYLASGATS